MAENPVLKREIITSLRTWRALGLGLAFIWLLGALVIALWPEGGVFSQTAQSGRMLFSAMGGMFLALVIICAPSFTATAITSEKENESWELLWFSMLTPAQIILGKLGSGIGFCLMLMVASLPMIGACGVGVDLYDQLLIYLIAVLAAVFFGLLGLYFSALCRSSYRALILCYVTVVLLCGGVWVPSFLFGRHDIIHLVRGLSPFAALTSIARPQYFAAEHPLPTGPLGTFADSPWVFIAFSGVGTLVLTFLSWRAIAGRPRRKHSNAEINPEKKKLGFPFYIFNPHKGRKMIGSIFNVIAVKEMRTNAFGKLSWFARTLCACFVLSMVMAFVPLTQLGSGATTKTAIITACISIPLAIIVLLCPVLTAGAISEEQESGVFDTLRTTRISAWKMLMGKLQVAWLLTFMLLVSAVPSYFMLVYLNSDAGDMEKISKGMNFLVSANFSGAWDTFRTANMAFLTGMLKAFGVMACTMVFCTSCGACFSSFCRHTSTATAIAYGISIFVCIGTLTPYFLKSILPGWLINGSLVVSPFAAATKAVSTGAFEFASDQLWLHNMIAIGALSLIIIGVTLMQIHKMMRPSR